MCVGHLESSSVFIEFYGICDDNKVAKTWFLTKKVATCYMWQRKDTFGLIFKFILPFQLFIVPVHSFVCQCRK